MTSREYNEYLRELAEYEQERIEQLEEEQSYGDAYMESHGSIYDNI